MTTRVCLAGATGWAGSSLAHGIARTARIEFVAAVSRTAAGRVLGDVLGEPKLNCPVYAAGEEALAHPCDLFDEFTLPEVAKANALATLTYVAQVGIGTSGLSDEDYAEIAHMAEERRRGLLAVDTSPSRSSSCRCSPRWRPCICRSGRSSTMPATPSRTPPTAPRESWRRG